MDLNSKIEIIVEFTHRYFGDKRFKTFFDYNNIGIPLALAVNEELCYLNSEGTKIIEETYNLLCFELKINNNISFDSIEDFFDEE
jgi:hypothetical protein